MSGTKKATKGKKSPGEWLSLAVAAATLVVMLLYIIYTSGLGTLNGVVVLFLLLIIGCNMIYFGVNRDFPVDIPGILEVAATVLTASSFVLFLTASINNLADLLNGIQIFSGATGSVEMIFTILITLLVIGVAEIITCFLKKS